MSERLKRLKTPEIQSLENDMRNASNFENLPWPDEAIPKKWVEKLFEKMLFTYGAKFSDQWKGIDPDGLKRHWATALGRYSDVELKAGVEKFKNRDWPPTLPEFEKMCRVSIDPLIAYYEAVAGLQARSRGEIGNWSSPAVFWAAASLAYDLQSQTYSQVKIRWENALAEQIAKGEWEPIKAPYLELAAPARISSDEARNRLDKLGASNILSPTGSDEMRWAKKIIEREKYGDKTLPSISIKMAKEALGIL